MREGLRMEESWSAIVSSSVREEKRIAKKRYEQMRGQCWRCRSTTHLTGIHHINADPNDQKPQNLLRLCQKCHNLIQGICDKCKDQKDCYIQKLQRCWRFEDSLPPIEFRPKDQVEGYDSHPEPLKPEKVNEIHNLIKIGHTIQSSMITETYLKSPNFLEHFVQCDLCQDWIRWKLPPKMQRLICAKCTIQLAGSPGWFKNKRLREVSP